MELYYDAFMDLTTCRSAGWGVGNIPWSVIKDYALTNEYDSEQMEDLFYYIRMMDNAYLDYRERKEKTK